MSFIELVDLIAKLVTIAVGLLTIKQHFNKKK
ncbi:hypothetical protein C7959_13912 [Orenia marismortui]|uniref:Uncharacterized protein n=1 Tax=Orenia marismortui TaxID=46469 RepID=A0A4R8GX76_9FIRM|nr:hypothetical protein C7959_13912 [Orenia marismortui]